MRCMRRSRVNAVNSTQAILANSDGCTPNPPRPNQRLVPFTGELKSTATRVAPTRPSSAQTNASFL